MLLFSIVIMELGVRIGRSKVGKRGQSSLAITIPKQVAENFNIQKGDVVEFYQNEGLIILKVVKNVRSGE